MEFIADLGLFVLKAVIIVAAVLTVIGFIFQMSSSRASRRGAPLEIEKLNVRFRSFRKQMQRQLLGKKQLKSLAKEEKRAKKRETDEKGARVFVVDFLGDIKATAVAALREEVTAILSVARAGDEVVLRLESGGGMVTSYGLAASQLARLKPAQIKLTVCVDKIAASGGYMMACVGDQILSAPFAVLGSIGVIAQVPNFNRLLKKNDIEYREVTAGQYKRTVTVFGEITEPGLQKFKEQIEETHQLFKSFVKTYRPKLNVEAVGTGEYWYGSQCVELGLCDQVMTSDEYLFNSYDKADVLWIRYQGRKKFAERISESFSQVAHGLYKRIATDLDRTRFEVR